MAPSNAKNSGAQSGLAKRCPVATLGDLLRYEWVWFGALLVFYVWLMEYLSARKALWFDELGTVFVATQPTLHALLHAEPPDGQPPLQYLLVRGAVGLFGLSESVVRLPALCGMLLAIWTFYLAMRHRSGSSVALVTMAAWVASTAGEYGAEARPYGLLMGFLGLAYLSWQRAAEARDGRGWWLGGLLVGVAGVVSAHPYGVVTVAMVFGLAEAMRWWQRRAIDWAMVGALLIGASFFGITLWMGMQTKLLLLHSVPASGEPAAYPTLSALVVEYLVMTRYTLRYVMLLALCAVPWFRKVKPGAAGKHELNGTPVYEWIAAWALSFSCCGIWLLTRFTNHYFWGRYGVASGLGIVMCASYVLSGIRWDLAVPATLILAMIGPLTLRVRGEHERGIPSRSTYAHTQLLEKGPRDEPIVIASGLHFLTIWWYSPPELRLRLHYVLDHELALQTEEFMPEMTLEQHRLRNSLPMTMEDLGPFLAEHRSFLLYSVVDPPQREWLPAELRRRGYSFRLVGGDVRYGPACTLYEVRAPEAEPR